MTAQIPEKLTNNMCEVDFANYELYSICVSEPADYKNYKGYPFEQKMDLEKCVVCSACWRGYISVYELTSSGEIQLVKFEYPFGRTPGGSDKADEILKGDFWLLFRNGFFGDELFVPFTDGKIVTDRDKWVTVTRT